MSVHLQRETDKLKKHILTLATMVEDNLKLAVLSLERRDSEIAANTKARDLEVDRMEVEIEEECLKVLALHQPVATDLRFVISVMKINNDLERMGDQAVNLANKSLHLLDMPTIPHMSDFQDMFRKTSAMLRKAVDALIGMNSEMAREVCAADDEVNALKKSIRDSVMNMLRDKPADAKSYIALMGAARNLERSADLATNIAEDIIYMVEGHIVRHGEKS